MKALILALAVLTLTACEQPEGRSPEGAGLAPGEQKAVVVSLHSSANARCFTLDSILICQGASSWMPSLGLTFQPITDASVSDFSVHSDSVCFAAAVAQMPVSRAAGTATYCIGLPGYASGVYPAHATEYIAVGPADISTVGAGSSDLHTFDAITYAVEAAWAQHSTFFTTAPTEDQSEALSCMQSSTQLVCPAFTVQLR